MDQRETSGIGEATLDALLGAVIELRVPADAGQLFLVRLLAEGIAARADFDLDGIADMKMAVDEVAASLVEQADPGAQLDFRFRTFDDEVTVSISTAARNGDLPNTQTFGWHVLTTLTDSVSALAEAPPTGRSCVMRIEFTMRARAVPT
jgi:serine/threonine-protein kinase RsbW